MRAPRFAPALLAALLLAGCTAAPASSESTASAEPAPSPAAKSAETPETPVENAGSAQPLRPLLEGDEKQYYMVEMVTGELIRYRVADLTAHETAVPCAVEGCAHDTEDCPAVFRRGECDKVFVLDEDTLVAFTNNNFPETEDSQVVLLDRDCQNRRVVATLPDAVFSALAGEAPPYTDGQYLYCFGFHGGYGDTPALFRIDPNSGEVTDLLEGTDAPVEQLLGALGTHFVLVQWEREGGSDDPYAMTSAAPTATVHWMLDSAGGRATQIARYPWKGSSPANARARGFGYILDGQYYQFDLDASTLRVWEAETGDFRLITDQLPAGTLESSDQRVEKVKDWLVFFYPSLAIHVTTGEARQKPALPDNYWNGSAHQPSIYLNLGDTLLVDCRYEPYVRTVIGTDGEPYTVDATHEYLGLISAEDYLNGVPNYTEVGEYIA